MHRIIELEGRLISIETKTIEINGDSVETAGKIVVYHPPLAAEHLPSFETSAQKRQAKRQQLRQRLAASTPSIAKNSKLNSS